MSIRGYSTERVRFDQRDLDGDDAHLLDEVRGTVRVYGCYDPGADVDDRTHRRAVVECAGEQLLVQTALRLHGGINPDDLCGVLHDRDREVWQTPHTIRPVLVHGLKSIARHVDGRPVQLLEVWMCVGPCRHAEPSG